MKILGAEIAATAAGPAGYPRGGLPEIAFLGRSNCGKSSLLNRLVQRRQLARTSGTPGKTRLLHFYKVRRSDRELLLVDLPGYGYARLPQSERGKWQKLVERYLSGRRELRAAVLLQDVRRDPGEDETLLVEWLHHHNIPVLLALTKLDKLKPGARARRLAELQAALPVPAEQVTPTSARTGEGIPELWRAVNALL